MKREFIIATFIGGLVLGGASVWFLKPLPPPPEPNAGRLVAPSSTAANVAHYNNERFGFLLDYPPTLTVREFDEAAGGMTIVFQSPGQAKGFQIFVTPYPTSTITEARIKEDIPGAVVKNPTEVLIGNGIHALHFASVAPIIGDSSETWFVHGGYLYEVTAYAALDAQMAGILSTMRFGE